MSTIAAYIQHYPACAKVAARISGRSVECSCGLDGAVKRLLVPSEAKRGLEVEDVINELREAMR